MISDIYMQQTISALFNFGLGEIDVNVLYTTG